MMASKNLPVTGIGQISATIASFSRTLDDYSETSKKELNTAKQDKAKDRIKAFRTELQDYRQRFDSIKRTRNEAVRALKRVFAYARKLMPASKLPRIGASYSAGDHSRLKLQRTRTQILMRSPNCPPTPHSRPVTSLYHSALHAKKVHENSMRCENNPSSNNRMRS